jgi:hypothetical protein
MTIGRALAGRGSYVQNLMLRSAAKRRVSKHGRTDTGARAILRDAHDAVASRALRMRSCDYGMARK